MSGDEARPGWALGESFMSTDEGLDPGRAAIAELTNDFARSIGTFTAALLTHATMKHGHQTASMAMVNALGYEMADYAAAGCVATGTAPEKTLEVSKQILECNFHSRYEEQAASFAAFMARKAEEEAAELRASGRKPS